MFREFRVEGLGMVGQGSLMLPPAVCLHVVLRGTLRQHMQAHHAHTLLARARKVVTRLQADTPKRQICEGF